MNKEWKKIKVECRACGGHCKATVHIISNTERPKHINRCLLMGRCKRLGIPEWRVKK